MCTGGMWDLLTGLEMERHQSYGFSPGQYFVLFCLKRSLKGLPAQKMFCSGLTFLLLLFFPYHAYKFKGWDKLPIAPVL